MIKVNNHQMKHLNQQICVLIILLGLMFSCTTTKRYSDYSKFPKGTVFAGELKDRNSTLYLIREDSVNMSGVCFINDNHAVVDLFRFSADHTGNFLFQKENVFFIGNLKTNKSNELFLSIPNNKPLNISSQKIKLNRKSDILNIICEERYKNPVFKSITATEDLQYGIAKGYYTSKPIEDIKHDDYTSIFKEMLRSLTSFVVIQGTTELPLYMDIYQPANDKVKKRPLFMFVHGGSFFFGDKQNKLQQAITDDLVKRGYVVASINYRLGSTLLGAGAIERTIYQGVQDARAALRYLVSHKNMYGIDEERIYVGGSSAGGIIAMTTTFMDSDEVFSSVEAGFLNIRKDLGGLDESGNKLKDTFQIAGIISMWGGLLDLQIINNNIPALLFHGTDDDIIPCNSGLPFKKYTGGIISKFAPGKLYGSESIHQWMNSNDIPAKYVPFHSFGHELQTNADGTINDTNLDIIKNEINDFLYYNVSKHLNYTIDGEKVINKTNEISTYSINNTHDATIQWEIDGGYIIEQSDKSIRVVWYDTYDAGKIRACITNNEGVSCVRELDVRIIK